MRSVCIVELLVTANSIKIVMSPVSNFTEFLSLESALMRLDRWAGS